MCQLYQNAKLHEKDLNSNFPLFFLQIFYLFEILVFNYLITRYQGKKFCLPPWKIFAPSQILIEGGKHLLPFFIKILLPVLFWQLKQ